MAQAIVTRKELKKRMDKIPKVDLAVLPTPLQECAHFSQKLGGPRIFIKREDLTGLAFGGEQSQKARVLHGRHGQ